LDSGRVVLFIGELLSLRESVGIWSCVIKLTHSRITGGTSLVQLGYIVYAHRPRFLSVCLRTTTICVLYRPNIPLGVLLALPGIPCIQ
jgi:hypothetical protein